MKNIHTKSTTFRDSDGREIILRGINLAGSSKIPYKPHLATHVRENFFTNEISFIGRPFPLEEADQHFQRLKDWGFRFLRLLITWEAIEHKGPGIYDEEYIEYIYQIAKKAGDYGFDLFIDPHQDVWSRFTGGDGAPKWTLEMAGLDVTKINDSYTALVHNLYGDPFPKMVWPANYSKLACATMFTLFFGGKDFAPQLKINGINIGDYLQQHYIDSIVKIAKKTRELPNVIGFDTLNEPSKGWIGIDDVDDSGKFYKVGYCPTPFQSMLLGSGIPQTVLKFEFENIIGKKELNQQKTNTWKNGSECIWKQHGVWDMDEKGNPVLLKPDYFSMVNGKKINFMEDYFKSFLLKFARAIQSVNPDYMIFVETTVEHRKLPNWPDVKISNLVNADHWYDEFTLITKTFKPDNIYHVRKRKMLKTKEMVEQEFKDEVAELRQDGDNFHGGIPTLVGEFGIPFDLNDRKAYETGDYSDQINALDRSYRAMEANLMNCTLWNYTPDNTHERGDQWNGEDLSVFSKDDQSNPEDINSGARAIEAFARPYPFKTAGTPLQFSFDIKTRIFTFSFRHDEKIKSPSVIIVPEYQYPDGYKVEVSDGSYEKFEKTGEMVYYHSSENEIHNIRILPV